LQRCKGTEPRLFKIPDSEGPAVALTEEYALDPVWSPSGEFLVYTAADVGTVFELHASVPTASRTQYRS
jgi:hypothetical protein